MIKIGRSVGIVLEIGDGVSQIMPIWEGYAKRSAVKKIDFGGRDLTLNLSNLLTERGFLNLSNLFEFIFEVFINKIISKNLK